MPSHLVMATSTGSRRLQPHHVGSLAVLTEAMRRAAPKGSAVKITYSIGSQTHHHAVFVIK